VLVEKAVRSTSGPTLIQGPMRFTKCKKEIKPKPGIEKGRPKPSAAAAMQVYAQAKPVLQKPGQMMTFADLQA